MTVLLAAAVFLCGAAQAEIRVNEFPGFDAIPEHFDLLADEMPPLPSAKIEPDGTIIMTGLKAWGNSSTLRDMKNEDLLSGCLTMDDE